MSEERTDCDKCYSTIVNGECSCGIWFEKGEYPEYLTKMDKAMIEFKNMNQPIYSLDHIPSNCSAVFFEGDFDLCGRVVEYVKAVQYEKNKGK